MTDQYGKVSREFLEGAVFSHLGARRSALLVKPGHGMDNAVISLGGKKVLLATSDPLSVIPSVGMKRSAWLSVHLLASDLATSGVSPQFALFDLNVPPEMGSPQLGEFVAALGDECKRLGIAIAGGHTGRYPGSRYTVVGGGSMFAVAQRGAYVTPAMARPGDSVLMTKGAAIGGTAVLAHSFPRTLRERVGASALRRAKARLGDCSTVRDAEVAASVGLHEGVTSMHDATEGGVLGGLFELSSACGLPVVASREAIHVPEDADAVCDAFRIDPLTTLSEGTLLVTCRPGAAASLKAALELEKIAGYEIGRVGPRGEGSGLWLSVGGSRPERHSPAPDGYWRAYSEALERGGG